MLTLTCRATGQPIPLRSDRFSGAVPLPDAPGCRVRSIDGEVFIAAETTSEIAAMLQPAPSADPEAAVTAARLLRVLADAPDGLWTIVRRTLGIGLGDNLDPALRALADRLDQR